MKMLKNLQQYSIQAYTNLYLLEGVLELTIRGFGGDTSSYFRMLL